MRTLARRALVFAVMFAVGYGLCVPYVRVFFRSAPHCTRNALTLAEEPELIWSMVRRVVRSRRARVLDRRADKAQYERDPAVGSVLRGHAVCQDVGEQHRVQPGGIGLRSPKVPLDYANPSVGQAEIAIVKLPSKYAYGDDNYRGPILFNPGASYRPRAHSRAHYLVRS